MELHKLALIVPTLNAGAQWRDWLDALDRQTIRPGRLLAIDSCSDDDTATMASEAGFQVTTVQRDDFDHGGTRQLGVELVGDAEIVVLLTQDAVLAHPCALERLLACFDDAAIGAAYGRQLPAKHAGPIEAHARGFNYPETSRVRSFADASELGIKTVFMSNSFGAYRRAALAEVGGFPSGAIFGEDTYVVAKMLLAGWKVAYCAEAEAYHSHSYSCIDELRRYFDVGVLHTRESWIRDEFGQTEGEGLRFVRSELRYLRAASPYLIPVATIRTALKLAGYKLGMAEGRIPTPLKRLLSANRRYWTNRMPDR